jgi:chemotaxis protein MotB
MSDPQSPRSSPLKGLVQHPAHTEEHGEGNWLVSYADMMTLLVGFFVIMLSFAKFDEEKLNEARRSITQEFGGQYTVPYSDLAKALREIAKALGVGDQFIIKESDIGIEISSRGTVFFESGSADLKPEADVILKKIIEVIRTNGTPFSITVEGHTDDVPVAPGHVIRNNFELSSIRACRVVEIFQNEQFPSEHLTAIGFGETRPLVPNRDSEGNAIPDNQAQNRRVVIKVLRISEPIIPTKENTAAVKPAASPAPPPAPVTPPPTEAVAPEKEIKK